MKKIFIAAIAFVLFSSHVMYLKFDSYFLEPNTPATIQLFNGTFDKSENVIDRDRMLDVSLLGNGKRQRVADSQWTEKDSVTLLHFQTGEPGTWVAGVSTAPRSIAMDADAFNSYLEHEGILDMLDWRSENNQMDSSAIEKYSKHVKTIFQVGDKRTDDWQKPLGYPIEFVPLDNPYGLHTGDSLRAQLLFKGKPLANQLVYANFKSPIDGHTHEDTTEHEHPHDSPSRATPTKPEAEAGHKADNTNEHGHTHETKKEAQHTHDDKSQHGHTHGNETAKHSHEGQMTEKKHQHTHKDGTTHSHDEVAKPVEESKVEQDMDAEKAPETHSHTSGQQLRTDANGVIVADLTADGIWYLQTIHLATTQEANFTHESNWTTLTFEVVHGHGPDTHTHEEEDGLPSYVYWIGSILLIGVLFFWFNKNN